MAKDPDWAVRRADLAQPADCAAVVALLEMYSREPLGAGGPLAPEVRQRLVPGLRDQPAAVVLIAWDGQRPIGLAVCFGGFSTFRARPLLNIHDLAVDPGYRQRGVGRALLRAVESEARLRGCCRLTLEVRGDNHTAQRLYDRFGFRNGDGESPGYGFWTKSLESGELAEAEAGRVAES